jgi:hypothetical protein
MGLLLGLVLGVGALLVLLALTSDPASAPPPRPRTNRLATSIAEAGLDGVTPRGACRRAVRLDRTDLALRRAAPRGLPWRGIIYAMAEREFSSEIDQLSATLSGIEQVLDIEALRSQAADLEKQASDPDLWNDPANAQKVTSRLSSAQADIRRLEEMRAGGRRARGAHAAQGSTTPARRW